MFIRTLTKIAIGIALLTAPAMMAYTHLLLWQSDRSFKVSKRSCDDASCACKTVELIAIDE